MAYLALACRDCSFRALTEDGIEELFDDGVGLGMVVQPLAEGDGFEGVASRFAETQHGDHGAGDLDALAESKGAEDRHGGGHVERGGDAAHAPEVETLAALVHEMDGAFPADFVGDAHPTVEVEEVGAAAEEDVLAVVPCLAGLRVFKGTGAAAGGMAGFQERHRDACGFEGDGAGHPGEARADDDGARLVWRVAGAAVRLRSARAGKGGRIHVIGRFGHGFRRWGHLARTVRQPMRSLVQAFKRTRSCRTRAGSSAIFARRLW